MIPLKGQLLGLPVVETQAPALPVTSMEQGVESLHREGLGSFKGLLFPPSHSLFRAREVSSCNISHAHSSYCGGSGTTALAGICLEEQVLVGLWGHLHPKEVNLEGMHCCLSSRALTLHRRATAPRVGCRGAQARGCPGVKVWGAAEMRQRSRGAPALRVGGCDDSAGAEAVQSQAGRRCWFDH